MSSSEGPWEHSIEWETAMGSAVWVLESNGNHRQTKGELFRAASTTFWARKQNLPSGS